MNRRTFCAASASVALRGWAATRRPNVVVVLADQWRAHAAGYAGDVNARTPAIDALCSESTDFTNAVSGCPVCSPYRGSLLTGQHPLRHGVIINDVPLKPAGSTLAQAFSSAGYRTGYIGKWHLFGSPDGKGERRRAFIPKENRCGFDYWKVCECEHNYNRSLYYAGDDNTPRYWDGYDAIAQTQDACAFIAQHARSDDPFLLVLSLGPPHSPYETAPARQRALYEEKPVRLRKNVPKELRDKAVMDLRGYYAHVAALDGCVKEVLASLSRHGLAEDTIFLFTSDHGDMLGSQGLHSKQTPWDESIRVPFLLRYPRKLGVARRVIRQPINTPDIMPTLLGMAGLSSPASVQGTDLSQVAAGAPATDSAALLCLPAPFGSVRRFGIAEYRGIRTRRHTYVRSIRGPWLLYDNESDPYQMQNLCNRPGQRAEQRELDRILEKKLRSVGDDFLPGEQYLQSAGLKHYRDVNVEVGQKTSPWGDWEATLAR